MTESETEGGIEIDGSASVRRASEPRVEEAESERESERVRSRVESRRGREAGVEGRWRSCRSCWENVCRAGASRSGVRWAGKLALRLTSPGDEHGERELGGLRMTTEPHCGTSH